MIEQEWNKLIKILESSKNSLPPKIYGKIKELFYNPFFRNRVERFRNVWGIPSAGLQPNKRIKWIIETLLKSDIKLLKNTAYKKRLDLLRKKAEQEIKNRPIEIWDIEKIKSIQKKLINDGEKEIFEKEILKITEEEFGLYPLEFWIKWLNKFFVFNELLLPSEYENPNCRLEPKLNEDTAEIELYIKINELTSIRDIEKYWKVVKNAQNDLKKDKKGIKRFYPKKILERTYKYYKLPNKKESIYSFIDEVFSGELEDLKNTKKHKNTLKKARQRMPKK